MSKQTIYGIFYSDWEQYYPISMYTTKRKADNALTRLEADMKQRRSRAHYYYSAGELEVEERTLDVDNWETGRFTT